MTPKILLRTGLIMMAFWGCCGVANAQRPLIYRIKQLSDSIKVGDLVIYNAFKYQVLAHATSEYDSLLVVDKVYRPYPQLWDKCLSQIFGNTAMFQQHGMVEWNRTLFDKQPGLLQKIDTLVRLNLDSLFLSHLAGLKAITGIDAKGKWILYAGPDKDYSIFLGGCDVNGMAIDIAHPRLTVNILTEALPHELEHMVFEQVRRSQPDWNLALTSTIDEGLACFYTYKYFKGNLPRRQVIENMTSTEFQWYLDHEKEIFEKSLGYLDNTSSEKTPYQCNCRAGGCAQLFNAPKTICYFLGFRIVEAYEHKHGEGSWKDVYSLPLKEFVAKSGYAEYIRSLK